MVLNSHGTEARAALVTVDSGLNRAGSALRWLYHGHWADGDLARAGTDDPPAVEPLEVQARDGRAFVRVDLPPAGMAVLASSEAT